MPLFEHTPHPHIPRNANAIHEAEQAATSFNERLAVLITKAMGTMTCAYVFAVLALIGFPGLHATAPAYVQWISQTFIQLVALSVLAVGQSILGHKQEIQADEAYSIALKNEHDSAQIAAHLAVQDTELIKQTAMLASIAAPSPASLKIIPPTTTV